MVRRSQKAKIDKHQCELKALNDRWSKLGVYIRDIKGDGNCLFRALGDQLEGTDAKHMYFRRETAEYISQNRTVFEPFIDDDTPFEKYVNCLSQSGCYGEYVSLVAFSRKFCVNIAIHQNSLPIWYLKTDKNDSVAKKTLHIFYHDWEHYSSIRNIDGPHNGPANVHLKALLSESSSNINEHNHINSLRNTRYEKFSASWTKSGDCSGTWEAFDDSVSEINTTNGTPSTQICVPSNEEVGSSCISTILPNQFQASFQNKYGGKEEVQFRGNISDVPREMRQESSPQYMEQEATQTSTSNQGSRRKKELKKRQRKANRMEAIRSKSKQGPSGDSREKSAIDAATMKLQNILL